MNGFVGVRSMGSSGSGEAGRTCLSIKPQPIPEWTISGGSGVQGVPREMDGFLVLFQSSKEKTQFPQESFSSVFIFGNTILNPSIHFI